MTLVDSNREWFKSCYGLDNGEGERAMSFCGHAMLADGIFIIQDTKADPRFADNPMVLNAPFIRFYAGVATFSADGYRIGTFCIKDTKPRNLTEEQIADLKALAAWAELELNTHELSRALESQKKAEEERLSYIKGIEKLNKLMVGRELKMVQLKKELKTLRNP